LESKKKIIISINTVWNLINFRKSLIQFLQSKDFEIYVMAQPDKYNEKLNFMNVKFIPIYVNSQKLSIYNDLKLFILYIWYFFRIKPDIFLGYTIKPNLYGSLAAKFFGIPVINNINGLGKAFQKRGLLSSFVIFIYRLSLSWSKTIFFQNIEDKEFFISLKISNHKNSKLLPGSGVNLKTFNEDLYNVPKNDLFTFILIARLLREKGIFEYIQAAKLIKKDYPRVKFQLMGMIDKANSSSISQEDIDQWSSEGIIEFLGAQDDVRPFLAKADCMVLPSYYNEGTPKCLLEAAAMSKPIITTDWKGCRNTVDHGVNGFLCKPMDPIDLYNQLKKMINLRGNDLQKFKFSSRNKAKMFDERIVFKEYLMSIREIL